MLLLDIVSKGMTKKLHSCSVAIFSSSVQVQDLGKVSFAMPTFKQQSQLCHHSRVMTDQHSDVA